MNEDNRIAIIGIGCRLPGGADDVESYWALLMEARSGIREVPTDRWDWRKFHHTDSTVPGRMVSRWGGFVDDYNHFDADLFGISPREAHYMDVQQRWLMETSWRALEDAGIQPASLTGEQVGVFVGISTNETADRLHGDTSLIDIHSGLGGALAIAANRVSFAYNFKGPSLAVDTACSSALVATSLAVRSITNGECDMALVGAANALVSPKISMTFSRASMLSPDGLCYTFDARANGYVRGEGAGFVVLKRLTDALADGDRVYAVIGGTAVNQDGQSSSLTVPLAASQEAMLHEAYQQAELDPQAVSYVEAHGTGTPVGDPIEAYALGQVVGRNNGASPTLIGSVKTNIGHLEPASGIAGLIKAALIMQRGIIPPHLNYETPNPFIPFAELGLSVVTEATPLPGESPIIGVNSFGFGGTNAHVVLMPAPAAPESAQPQPAAQRPLLLPISARDDEELRHRVNTFHTLLREADDIAALAAAAGKRQPHLEQRMTVIGTDAGELRAELRAFLNRTPHSPEGHATAGLTQPVFVFTGQGPQWWGMGQQLITREPLVRETVEAVDALFTPLRGWSLMEEMTRPESESRIHDTDVAQPAIFALQVALLRLWRSWGVHPAAVIGHSVGEVAAAYAAGIYTLADAVSIITHRSRLQHHTKGRGTMAAVGLSLGEALHRLKGCDVQIAAVNSASLVTIAGAHEPLEATLTMLGAEGVFVKALPIDYAFHTAQMDLIHDELLASLANLNPHEGDISFISTVTASPQTAMDAHYWWRNVREPVSFAAALAHLTAEEHTTFLEVGPHPSLASSLREGTNGHVFHSLRRGEDESREMLRNAARLHIAGLPLDWEAINQVQAVHNNLPPLRFEHKPYGIMSESFTQFSLEPESHPLLGARINTPVPTWEVSLDVRVVQSLSDHRIWGSIVMPAAAFAEIGLAVGRELYPQAHIAVEELQLKQVMFLPEDNPLRVRVSYDEGYFRVYSFGGSEWQLHAEGVLRQLAPPEHPSHFDITALKASLTHTTTGTDFYQNLREMGYIYGPAFQGVQNVWTDEEQGLTEIAALPLVEHDLGAYIFHPGLLDSCLQTISIKREDDDASRRVSWLPAGIGRLEVFGDAVPAQFWAVGTLTQETPFIITMHIDIYDERHQHIARIRRARFERTQQADLLPDDLTTVYHFEWQPKRLRSAPLPPLPPVDVMQVCTSAAHQAGHDHHIAPINDVVLSHLPGLAHQGVINAWLACGFQGQPFTFTELVDTLGVIERHHTLLRYHIQLLVEGSLLQPINADSWKVAGEWVQKPIDPLWEAIITAAPALEKISLFKAVLDHLADLYRGLTDPLDVLFAGDALRTYYQLPDMAATYQMVVEGLRAMHPGDRPLRILEVGAGTGAQAEAIITRLGDLPYEYTFTDVSAHFFKEAQHRLPADVTYTVFDITTPPDHLHSYDVVLAANVVHVVEDIPQALEHLRACLASGGTLFMAEVTEPSIATHMIFGLLPEWWRDEGFAAKPHDEWLTLLEGAGFDDPAAVRPGEQNTVVTFIAPHTTQEASEEKPLPPALLITNDEGLHTMLPNAQLIDKKPTEADLLSVCERLKAEHIVLGWRSAEPTEAVTIAFRLARALTALDAGQGPPVTLVTWGAQPTHPGHPLPDLANSSLTGFVRVVNNEHPTYLWRLIDFDTPGDLHHLLHELRNPDGEREVAYREGERYVNQLKRTPLEQIPPRHTQPNNRPYRVEMTRPGRLSNLRLNLTGLTPLQPHEAQVAVKAVGLNFRDVMKVLGMLPTKTDDLLWLGDDIAGEVQAVGEAVTHLKPGGRVFGFAPYGLRSHLTVDARSLHPMPGDITYEQAATIPTVFNTAHYALVTAGRLQPGETVLIHSATGGVGQAAVQVAQALGLTVIGTAGTPEKRALLREQGVAHVFHSRTLNFADDVLRVTGGRGVDAVLNALAGDFIPKSLSVLAPFGRFLEIGKVDIYGNSKLGMATLKDNISFHVIDLAQMLTEYPERAQRLFAEVSTAFQQGDYSSLRHTTFPIAEVEDAFRYMAGAKHIGKVVVSFEEPAPYVGLDSGSAQRFNPDGEYLVVGGVRGFGLKLVEWLAAQGARHFTLMSRSGVQEEEAAAKIEALRADGASITIAKGDVTVLGDVQRVVEGVTRPLVGVVHSALLLHDGLIVAQHDEAHWQQALTVKAVGALNLHHATLGHPLELFLCLSSSSSMIGALSQSNYAAGNTTLDALAYHRQAQGLPALTVNYGALGGTGYFTRNLDNAEFLDKIGMHTIHYRDALRALGRVMQAHTAQAGIISADWRLLASSIPMLLESPTYAGLVQHEGNDDTTLLENLLTAKPEERPPLLRAFITRSISGVLDSPIDDVEMETPIASLGLDSLMSVELVNMVNRQLNRIDKSLAVSEVLGAVTIGDIVETLLKKFSDEDGNDAGMATAGLMDMRHLANGDHTLDLHAEATLDSHITADVALVGGFSHVLLTGATGFLGAYLLRDLLTHTEAVVTCVVRAGSSAAAFERVQANLERYDLWVEVFAGRIRTCVGDISQPHMGLTEYDTLAAEVNVILHNASQVNLVQPYHALKPGNVGGTEEILRFATHLTLKPVHLVSTTGVFYRGQGEETPITESEWPDPARLPNGYRQSKWVAEQLVRQAIERGIPATIYRPGFITGDSVTGASNPDDLLNRILIGTAQLGACSTVESVWNMTPVDYVSRAIVHLAQQPEAMGRVFHVVQPENTTLSDLLSLGLLDDGLHHLPYRDWRDALLQQHQHGIPNAMHPIMAMFGDVPTDEIAPLVDRTNTEALLAGTGITCPPVDERLMAVYGAYLRRVGALPEAHPA